MPAMNRRQAIRMGAIASAGMLTAACGSNDRNNANSGDGSGSNEGPFDTLPSERQTNVPFILGAAFPANAGYLTTGSEQRMPFLIAAGDGAPIDELAGTFDFVVTPLGDGSGSVDSANSAPMNVPPRNAGLSRAYLPLRYTFDEPGQFAVSTSYEGVDLSATVTVGTQPQTPIVGIGDEFPTLKTPTASDPRGVSPICTADPVCPLHTVSLDDALANEKPTLLLISTPQYCQTAICGPVLDFLVAEYGGSKNFNAIHAEVYKNPNDVDQITKADLADVVTESGLSFEPSLFVIGSDGMVTERLDFIFDSSELHNALVNVLPQ